jgi:hypothetical protein
MAQSLAREFGPKGVHVSHAIIDGIIDTEKTKGFSQDIPDSKIDPKWVSKLASVGQLVLALIIRRLRNHTGFCIPSPGLRLPMK